MKANNYKSRHLEKRLPRGNQKKLILITGARQTGKTSIAKNQYPLLKYLNFDAPEIREKVKTISTYSWVRDIGIAILDEVQKEPIALEKIKYCFDEKSLDFSVLLGSSQLMLLKKVRESLAGRISLYELFPFMVSEVLHQNTLQPPLLDLLLQGHSIDQALNEIPTVLFGAEEEEQKQAFNYILQWGGMPALFNIEAHEERKKWLKDYEYTYLERDLVDLARIHDLEPFRKFQSLAAHGSGQLLSYSELARDASISVDTSRRYFEYLRLSYQTFFLQPYYSNNTTSLIKTPKVFWLDMGMLRQATGQWETTTGHLFETLVISEIYKWIKTNEKEVSLYFYRTHGGLECDLLLQTPKGFIGVEIKMRDKIYPKDLTSLQQIEKKITEPWLGSILIYDGHSIEKLPGDNNWAIPAWRLLS